MRNANGQIGQIGDIAKIRQRPRNAGEDFPVPRGDDKIRVAEHRGHSFALVNRPAFAQRRSAIQFNDGIEIKVVARFVGNHRTRILQSNSSNVFDHYFAEETALAVTSAVNSAAPGRCSG